MDIGSLWFTQHSLKRADQVKILIDLVKGEEHFKTPIELQECGDGEIEIVNGHHRVTALWLAGKRKIDHCEYNLSYKDVGLRRFFQVEDLESKKEMLKSEGL